ncbi:endonuclease/exonuclease/phosphatase family protein [Micromonospora sp. NPDC049559]|uniref:endonuclease/exonuclease/phosphatase family protein n=1 Tax=Micromonospora sp. NPDC049559 TaxID=3155923 RepID=UPI00342BF71F
MRILGRSLALLVATLLVVPVGSSASGGTARAGGGGPATVAVEPAADASTAAAATVGLRVISHNICGGASCGHRGQAAPLTSVTDLIDDFRPHLVLLQEVCWSQFEALQAHSFSSGPYQMGFTTMIDNYTGCGASDCRVNEDTDPANDNRLCWTGQVVAARGTLANRDEIPLGGERHQVNASGEPVNPPREFNALCYDVALAEFTRTVKGCTVHLRAWNDPAGENARARAAQTATLASDLDGDIAAGKIVVVGGDFNSTPTDFSMNAFYRLNTNVEHGWGRYYEADQDDQNHYNSAYCSASATACRSGQNTHNTAKKLDYIFFSETTDPSSLSALPIDEPMSDHFFYRGLANVRAS